VERDREHLAADLGRLGVAARDLPMVHASLRAVGPVAGGADTLIDALEATVGPDRTRLMTLGARDDSSWVNERPERDRPELLRDAEPFDRLVTPADPDVHWNASFTPGVACCAWAPTSTR
jgi:aminoglycoside N3'-acetyltransferase